jgi:hypothetical protein
MKVANSQTQFRILLTQTDKELLTPNGEMSVYVKLNVKGVMDFIQISPRHMHSHEKLNIITGSGDHPWMVMLQKKGSRRWSSLNTIPLFAPETVMIKEHEHSEGTYWDVMRPPMERPVNGGKKPAVRKPKTIEVAPPAPGSEPSRALVGPVDSALPKVEKSPPKAELTEAALINNLRAARRTINQAKEHYGDELVLGINPEGKLTMLLGLDND